MKRGKLKEVDVTKKNRPVYCGPTVVSAITGVSSDRVTRLMLKQKKQRYIESCMINKGRLDSYDRKHLKLMYIKGTYWSELERAIRHYRKRWRFSDITQWIRSTSPKPIKTIEDWIILASHSGGPKAKTTYIIDAGNHWVVLRDDTICDTQSHGIPTPYHKHPWRGRHLKHVYKVTELAK
jgi:hypothetical protein